MKQNYMLISSQARRLALTLTGTALLAAATRCLSADVLPPSSLPYGASYEEWSAKWWQWSLSQSANNVDLVGNADCCPGPASQVWFLAGASGPIQITNRIIVPGNTALFFPVLTVWVDNSGCGTNGLPSFTDLTVPQLRSEAEGLWSEVSETSCWIDGVAVAGLSNPTNSIYNVQSPAFSYTTAFKDNVVANVYGETCIPGGLTIYPAVADGMYLMVAPLPPGHHTIHWIGVVGPASAPYFTQDITYTIDVFDFFGGPGY